MTTMSTIATRAPRTIRTILMREKVRRSREVRIPLTFEEITAYHVLNLLGNGGMAANVDLMQGTLDVLVLKALSWGPKHGHAAARLIHASTGGAFEVLDGSLYAALHRMEERGWVDAEWGLSDKG